MIVAPDTLGAGRGRGQAKDSWTLPLVMDTSGAVPPPENVSGSAAAAGL
ncbi:hypothetical protein GCM10010335_49840 [Streptomyces galbus]|nr:hypothetical protein GCM10010335_49840 [Streptomyces galbus]